MPGILHFLSRRTAIAAATCLGAIGLAGCESMHEQNKSPPLSTQREQLAMETARHDYQRRFPAEYGIAVWEIIILEKQGSLWVMFANPIPEQNKAVLGDIPRSGRLYILSIDGARILDTMIM